MRTKRLILFGLILIMAGAITFGVAFMRADWDITVLDGTVYTAETLDLSDEIFDGDTTVHTVNAYIPNYKIHIFNGDEFKINYYTSEKSSVEKSYQNGEVTLSVKTHWTEHMRGFSGINKSQLIVSVTVPAGAKLKMNSPSGLIKAESVTLGDVNLSSNSGSIRLINSTLGLVNASAHSGNIKLENVQSGEVSANGNSATFTIKDSSINGDVTLNGSSSNARIENLSANNLNVSGNSANWWLTGSNLNDISYKGNSSDLRVYGLITCASITLRGSSSSVKGDGVFEAQSFAFEGNSSTFRVYIKGSLDDFNTLIMSGSSSTFRVDDKKNHHTHVNGAGSKVFTMKGNSSSCRVWFVA